MRRGGRTQFLSWAGALALSLLGGGHGAEPYIEDTAHFPGWKGELPELPVVLAAQEPARPVSLGAGEPASVAGLADKVLWPGDVVEISRSPRAFLYKGFLSEAECDHLIKLAKPLMENSTVVDDNTGEIIGDTGRTSTGAGFLRQHDEVVSRIERRIAMVTHMPEQNGEGLQILHYVNGQKYEPHYDYFHDKYHQSQGRGGQRIATVLMYLTTPKEGGETVFPKADNKVSGPGWSECARQGAAVKTRRGSALVFYSLLPSGEVDPASLHGSCPTTLGEKWSATKRLHVGEYKGSAPDKGGACEDADERCPAWALDNQCTINPGFMLARCRKSCACCESPDERSAAS